jgi:NitT/TauT family transport system substrate-binding protein
MMRTTVRTILAALLAAAALAAARAPAAAGELKKVKITQAVESLIFLPTYVARARGFFAEEGLEVEQISTGGGGPEVQALIAGEADFAVAGATYHLSAMQQGKKLLAVANLGNKMAVNFAIHKAVAAERGITEAMPFEEKLKRIKGLTFGPTRPGALTWQVGEYIVRRAGLDPQKDVQMVAAGAGPTLLAALEQRKIDVLIQSIPVPETAIHRGHAIMLFNLAKGEDPLFDEFMLESLLVRPDWARANADLVRRAVRAHLKANRWIGEHSAEQIAQAVKAVMKVGFPDEVLVAGVGSLKKAFPADGVVTERALTISQDMMVKAGELKTRFKLDEVFTAEYLPK